MNNERRSTPIYKKIITILLSMIFFTIQLTIYYIIFFGINGLKGRYEIAYNTIYLVVQILGILIVFQIYNKNLNIGYKLSWTIFILLAPFLGTMWYLVFGNGRNIPKRKNRKIDAYLANKIPKNDLLEELKNSDDVGYKLAMNLYNSTKFPVYKNTKTLFFNDASLKHQDLLEELKNATKYIFLEYFIIADGSLLNDIITILEEKGKIGIEIKIIYDDVGSRTVLRQKTINKLKDIPNLKMAPYEPLGININPSINYRDHRKIAIIDGRVAYCGGDNLADEYIHNKKRFGYWRDNALKLEGDAVNSYILLFAGMWYMSCKEMLDTKDYFYNSEFIRESFIMPFGDGPTNFQNPAYNLFLNMISNANKSIYISTPYFIIDQTFIATLTRAAKSGVDVKILVPHIPDKKTIFMLTRAHFGEILKNGGKIYEYSPGFNHAKNIIIDNKYAFIGTVNIDYRSLFLHFECGTLLINDWQVRIINNDFLEAIEISKEITYEEWQSRPGIIKIFELLLNVLAPLL